MRMKKLFPFVAIVILLSCGQRTSNKSSEVKVDTLLSTNEKITQNVEDQDKYIGTFEFVYPYNTEDLIENHFIVINKNGDLYSGLYYGTSDEFDESREGYLPGFFVAPMEQLTITNGTLKFTLSVENQNVFNKAVELKYKSSEEARQNGYETWPNMMRFEPKTYFGFINNDSIIINDKTFHKK